MKSTPSFNRAALAVAASLLLSGAASAADGLSALAGSWSGGGTITTTNGGSERLRCRATYSVGGGGASASQDLRCASDSYRVDIVSNVAVNGQTLSGTWRETSRGVSGQLSGRVNGSDITATISGGTFGAGLSIATRGSAQNINLRVQGGDVSNVSISLKRN